MEYEIRDIGGVEKAVLELKPGINVLEGKNGAGKTSAIDALVRAHGGDARVERRDGAKRGEVRGPGIYLRVGEVATKQGEVGEVALSLADHAPLGRLIDPQIKGSEAANRARIRALIELLGLQVDDESLEALTGGDEPLKRWLREHCQAEAVEDLIEASEALRHQIHSRARTQEQQAEEAHGRAEALQEQVDAAKSALGEAGPTDQTPEAAMEALREGERAYERAQAQCEAREALEARQAALAGTLGDRPDPEALDREIEYLDETLGAMDQKIQDLEAKLAQARGARAAKAEERAAKQRERDAVGEAVRRWDEAQAELAKTPEGPTREELEAMDAKLRKAPERELERARHSQAMREAATARTSARETEAESWREAKRLRGLAHELPERLGKILSDAGAEGLTVVEGRLAATDGDRGPLDFERRLSTGQRVAAALRVAAPVYQGRVLPLDGVHWAHLDPQNQAAFAQQAAELGLYVLTELPAEGAMRLEHLGGDEAA